MARTRRASIDGGFAQSGSAWSNSGSFVDFPPVGYVQFDLNFIISLDSQNSISTLTLWNNGVLSLGPPTQEQVDFFASGASPIPAEGNPGFPGEFFLFDYTEGAQSGSYSFGIGIADYAEPYDFDDAVQAAFFTFENGFQIIIDQNGFSILSENGNFAATNGYFIGALSEQNTGFGIEYDFGFPDLFTYYGTADADTTTGTEFHETFFSSTGADVIDGASGVDLLSYRDSSGSVSVNLLTNVNAGNDAEGDQLFNIDTLEGSLFADVLTGDDDGNSLFGLDGADTIKGGSGGDLIDGGAGADHLTGGAGVDTLSYLSSSAGISVSLEHATASGGDAEGDSFGGFERLIGSFFDDILRASASGNSLSGVSGDDTLIGLDAADSLDGGDGNDFLIGGGGGDLLDGYFGLDTASYASSWAAVAINLQASTSAGGDAEGDHLFSIENLVGSVFGDSLTGNFADNRLSGDGGNDRLYGGDGNDVLLGGDGNDILKGDAGIDVLVAGAGDDSLSGGFGMDIMAGDAGNDLFDGGAGSDAMTGGIGDDTFYVDNPGDTVVEGAAEGVNDRVFTSISYTLGAGVYVEELATTKAAGTAAINLTGNQFSNRLIGNAGANILDGRAGADTLEGGLGDDTYFVDNAGDLVRETLDTGGTDTVRASVSFSLGKNLENLTLLGAGAISGSGNELDNILRGNGGANLLKGGAGSDTLVAGDGDDTLNGGTGADILDGGLGNDTYLVDDAGDIVIDAGGSDTVSTGVTYSVGGAIENLTLTGNASINGSGNNLDNVIRGNSGVNVLKGGAGRDTLFGDAGNDVLNGGTSGDVMDGGLGNDLYLVDDAGDVILDAGGLDTVSSSVTHSLGTTIENLTLTGSIAINGSGNSLDNILIGNAGANVLKGGAGLDSLFGGLGADTLSGGAGADNFYFDTALGGANVDRITDFSAADDTFYLDQSIFGAIATGALASSAFRAGTAALDADDRIIYDSASGQLWYDADGSGSGAAVHFADVTLGAAISNADFFILV